MTKLGSIHVIMEKEEGIAESVGTTSLYGIMMVFSLVEK